MKNWIFRKLLGPAQGVIVDHAKTISVTAASSVGGWLLGSKFASVLIGLGVPLSDEYVAATATAFGALVAGIVADLMTEYRRGGTKALQGYLNKRFGIPLKDDDWFGPETKKAVDKLE